MNRLHFDLSRNDGKFKMMHAVNNGPIHKRHAKDQNLSNIISWTAAKIPMARNHDASYCSQYGGEHSVDISAIFPDFSKDPYAPESYDFACTDELVLVTLDAGTKIYYRLGQKIEHYIKKFSTLPPPDFKKWAIICEHIIRHYNEGWANGFKLNIEYWEIWNEPDLDPDDSKDKRTWGGTQKQFLDLFEITAKHLKKCFPELKIGGPALAMSKNAEFYLSNMKKRGIPVDFFSWHIYCNEPVWAIEAAKHVREMMIKYGYGDKESILNEWNYVKGWSGAELLLSLKSIASFKGASFTMAMMAAAQNSEIDILMYYDARPCGYNGLFAPYTYECLKGYYPFLWFSQLYECERQIICSDNCDNIYTLCGISKEGKVISTVTYYSDDDGACDKDISIDFGKSGRYSVYMIGKDNYGELIGEYSSLDFKLPVNSTLFIKEI